jgi:hypothetical protein
MADTAMPMIAKICEGLFGSLKSVMMQSISPTGKMVRASTRLITAKVLGDSDRPCGVVCRDMAKQIIAQRGG